jgi:hypothetical protein
MNNWIIPPNGSLVPKRDTGEQWLMDDGWRYSARDLAEHQLNTTPLHISTIRARLGDGVRDFETLFAARMPRRPKRKPSDTSAALFAKRGMPL